MLNRIFKSVSNGEIIKVVEFNEKSKQCIVELENGKTRAYQSATLKDKRKFTPVEDEEDRYVAEIMQQKAELGIECPKIDPKQVGIEEVSYTVDKDTCDDGTSYAEIGKEIAEQAKEKAQQAKANKVRKSLRLKEVTYKGETKSLREWAEEANLKWKTLYNRINNNGWPVDLAIETPEGERRPKEKKDE